MSRQAHLQRVVRDARSERDGQAFVLVGSGSEPAIRYCLSELDSGSESESESESNQNTQTLDPTATYAVALDGERVLECGPSSDDDRHPAERLASRLVERWGTKTGTLLTPRTIPHDAALYLEGAGFSLTSSDCLERAREQKTATERDRIERAQTAATAGLERAGEILAGATVGGSDRALAFDGDPLTSERVRIAIDEAIVRAGGFPAGSTVVRVGTGESRFTPDVVLRAGEPITLETTPYGPNGYYGGLARTVVVDGDGGWERRAHVAVTHAFKSAASLLSTEGPTVHAVEADLAAEVRAFGFEDGIETSVHGVGLEPRERPLPGDEIGGDCVLRLEAAVVGEDGGEVRLADCLERVVSESEPDSKSKSKSELRSGSEPESASRPIVDWLPRPSQSLEASALE
ncbi:M24 family metallopeptidase [Natronoglomus mannanivorans]|uniref:M24 family metallopeptidase n=1 Tax=Natronoglomus mannanivorans TaxID=2979990 RepID=A0AAP3E3P4_9EURY|nr:M24 family metallopeptidase [Halobacteria archaeon AArc-xg1-1]